MLIILQFVGPMKFVVTSILFNYSKTLLLCKQIWFTVGSESDVLKQNLLRTTAQWFEFGQHSCKLHGLCTVSVWDKKGMERGEKTSKEKTNPLEWKVKKRCPCSGILKTMSEEKRKENISATWSDKWPSCVEQRSWTLQWTEGQSLNKDIHTAGQRSFNESKSTALIAQTAHFTNTQRVADGERGEHSFHRVRNVDIRQVKAVTMQRNKCVWLQSVHQGQKHAVYALYK